MTAAAAAAPPADARALSRGLGLAAFATLLWGCLPIAMTFIVQRADVVTITWFRFTGAALALGAWLAWQRRLPWPLPRDRRARRWLAGGTLAVLATYLLSTVAIRFLPADACFMISQMNAAVLLLMSWLAFGERVTRQQWFGTAVMVGGLLLYFRGGLAPLLAGGIDAWVGVAIMLCSAVSWSAYACFQRVLRPVMGTAQSLTLMFAAAALVLTPWAAPAGLLSLDALGTAALLYSTATTVLAYGSFALAVALAPTAAVGAVTAQGPFVTAAATALVATWLPAVSLPRAEMTALTLLGVALIVAGALLCLFGPSPRRLEALRADDAV
jgi:drug/metabolite transporter (DMT)-like permease